MLSWDLAHVFFDVFLGNFRVEMKLGKGKVGSLFVFFV